MVDKRVNAQLKLVDKLNKKGEPYSMIEVHVVDDETGEDFIFHSIYVKAQHREVYNFLLERANAT